MAAHLTDPVHCVQAADQATFVGQLVETAISQSDLLVTLSTAVLGALLALVLQATIHNRGKDSRPIILPSVLWIVLAGILLGVSIVAGFLVQGGYVNNLPILYAMKIDCSKVLLKQDVENLPALAVAAQVQFWSFFVGVVVVAFYLLRASKAAFHPDGTRNHQEPPPQKTGVEAHRSLKEEATRIEKPPENTQGSTASEQQNENPKRLTQGRRAE